MPIYEVNFGERARGEQVSTGPKTQSGPLEMRNVDNRDGAARKRPGAAVVSLSRSDDPVDLIENPRTISSRGPEVVLYTDDELYAHQQCGLAGASSAGTATPTEVNNALAAVQTRRDTSRTIDVALPGYAVASNAQSRLDRPEIDPDVVITPSGRTITFSATASEITVTEGAITRTIGLNGIGQRLVRMTARDIGAHLHSFPPFSSMQAEDDVVIITWLGKVSGASPQTSLRHLIIHIAKINLDITDLQAATDFVILDTLKGPADLSRYETQGGAIVGFPASGSAMRIWDLETPATSQGYAIANPPDAGAAYAVDISANLFPGDADGLAVTWASASDGIQHAAQVRPTTSVIVAERSSIGRQQSTSLQVSIVDGPLITWGLADKATGFGTPPGFTDRPVSIFDPSVTDIKFADLSGDDLRVAFNPVAVGDPDGEDGQQEYVFRNATTNIQLYEPITVQGMTDETDAQWGLQADTIYGILTSAADGLHEVRWQRTADIVAAAIGGAGAVTKAAMAISGTRLTVSYWLSDGLLAVRRWTDIFTGGTVAIFTPIPDAVGVFGSVIGSSILAEPGPDQVDMIIQTFRTTGEVLTLATDGVGVAVTLSRVDNMPEIPLFVESNAEGTPPRAMMGVSYASQAIEIYEVNTSLFVRVSPVQEVRAGGNWSSRGRWTRTSLRSDVVSHQGTRDVLSADAATIINDEGEPCTFVASEIGGGIGARFDVLSTHNEAQGVIDATGRRPRVSQYDATRLFVGYEDSGLQLNYAVWSPGSALSFSASAVTLRANRTWDQTGFKVTAEPAGAWASVTQALGANDIRIDIIPDLSAPFFYTRFTDGVSNNDVSVSVRVLPDGVTAEVSWGACGIFTGAVVSGFIGGIDSVNMTTQVVTPIFQFFTTPGADVPRAISVDSRDGVTLEAWVEFEGPINRRVEVWDIVSGGSSLSRTYKRAALASQLAPIRGSVVGTLSLLGTSSSDTDVVDTTFVGGKAYRNGLLVLSATTSEVLGRVAIGEVEDYDERLLRVPKTGLNIGPNGRLDLGWQETDLDIGMDRAPTLVRYSWTPLSSAHEPGVLNSILVAAHGGYPRMYDGENLNEHDFHELPEIVQVAIAVVVPGTGLPVGQYNVAVTFESYDATGKLYRSRPTFSGPHTIAVNLGEVINVTTRDLTVTERPNIRTVLWRTTEQTVMGADPTYYRETEALATLPVGANATLTSLVLADSLLREREALDQGDLAADVLPADPIAVTDFTAALDGRLWGVNPRQRNAMYYTVANRPGKAAHWSLAQTIQHDGPEEVTALLQMGSRIAFLTRLNGSAFYTPGPDFLGSGAYTQPEELAIAVGTDSHATLARIPEGTVFGAARKAPPQLLTGGWTMAPIGHEIHAAYDRDGQVARSIAFVQAAHTLHVIGSTPESTHRLNLDSNTWSTDTFRQALDLTVRANGQLVILATDGRVLFEDQDVFASGGAGYVTSVRTKWLEAEGRHSIAGNFNEVQVLGAYEGAHDLVMNIRLNFREEIVESVYIPAATLAAHAAANREYVYGYKGNYPCGAVSIEILDNGPPNKSFAIEQIVVATGPAGQPSVTLRDLLPDQKFIPNP